MHTAPSHGRRLPALAGSLAIILAACTSAASPGATFGPGNTIGPTTTPAVTPSMMPTDTPAPTATASPEPTPFVAGTVDAPREIAVTMTDAFRFEPDAITVQAGETVRFVLTNAGVIQHDFTIGDQAAQDHHEMEMMSGDMHHGGDPNAILVEPGATGELVFTFGDPGRTLIGCHVPGHYAAGMKGTIEVQAGS